MRTQLSLAAVVVLSLAAGCTDDVEAAGVDWKIVENRVWIERMPKNERDMIRQLVLLNEEDGKKPGAVMRCSKFRWLVDAVKWSHKGSRLHLNFLQVREEREATVRSWSCKGDAPKPFELCLELSDGDKKRRYYSMKEWVVDDVDDARAAGAAWLQPASNDEGGFDGEGDDDDDDDAAMF
ncbi:MAG: hypothetical protein Q8O67_19305 [Deltaproteobacteria bacterium]|nr:hypothetical protein [Deltaproteobacteria bacterium]